MVRFSRRTAASEPPESSEQSEPEAEVLTESDSGSEHFGALSPSSGPDSVDAGDLGSCEDTPSPPEAFSIPIPAFRRLSQPPTQPPPPSAYRMKLTHLAFELIERRIVQDRCSGFTDPCDVADVPRERFRQVRRDEADDGREGRYRTIARMQLVPNFWPKRSWDTEAMSDAESRRLAAHIVHLEKRKPRKEEDEKKRSQARRGRVQPSAETQKLIVQISKLDFSTDNIDEFTVAEL